jgi:DNA-binding protein H-NS
VGGKAVPFALILRFNITENMNDSNKYSSYLTVSKITPGKICTTDNRISPAAGANEAARRAADASADKPCIE